MAIDPTTLPAGTITHEAHGTTFAGESATRLFQVRVIMRSLEFEHRTGLRMTGKRSVADAARAEIQRQATEHTPIYLGPITSVNHYAARDCYTVKYGNSSSAKVTNEVAAYLMQYALSGRGPNQAVPTVYAHMTDGAIDAVLLLFLSRE